MLEHLDLAIHFRAIDADFKRNIVVLPFVYLLSE